MPKLVEGTNSLLLGIQTYLLNKTYLKGFTQNEKRNIRKRCKDFKIENGDLFFVQKVFRDRHATENGDKEYERLRKALLTDSEKLTVIAELHTDENGSHNGVEKTSKAVQMLYYWVGITDFVRKYVRDCSVCAITRIEQYNSNSGRNKEKQSDHYGVLVNIDRPDDTPDNDDNEADMVEDNSADVSRSVNGINLDVVADEFIEYQSTETSIVSYFWHTVEFKVFGPFNKGDNKLYVCIGVDVYSNWTEVKILEDISVISMAHFILQLVCRFGKMTCIYLKDEEECGINNTDLIQVLNSSLLTEITYNTSSSTQTDNLWEILSQELTSFITKHSTDWNSCLDLFLLPFRFSCPEKAEYSPAFLMCGREPKLLGGFQEDYCDLCLTSTQLKDSIDKIISIYNNINSFSSVVKSNISSVNKTSDSIEVESIDNVTTVFSTDEDQDDTPEKVSPHKNKSSNKRYVREESEEEYIVETDVHLSVDTIPRRSLRCVKQDWSYLYRKRKHSNTDEKKKEEKTPSLMKRKNVTQHSKTSAKRGSSDNNDSSETNEADIFIKDSNGDVSIFDNDEFYRAIKHYLMTSKHIRSCSNSMKTTVCKSITSFSVDNDDLYYQPTKKHRKKRIILNEEDRVMLMAEAHIDDEGTHLCKRKVIDCISAMDYYWRGLTLDCEAFVIACPECCKGDIRKVHKDDDDNSDTEDTLSVKDDDNLEVSSEIIKTYLTQKKYPKGYTKKKKTTLRRKTQNYVLKDGDLYYRYCSRPQSRPRLCLFSKEDRIKAIKAAHIVSETKTHLGLNKTQEKIKSKYYWVGQTNDVYLYISQCCFVTDKSEVDQFQKKQSVDQRKEKFSDYFNQRIIDSTVSTKQLQSLNEKLPSMSSEILTDVETSDIPTQTSELQPHLTDLSQSHTNPYVITDSTTSTITTAVQISTPAKIQPSLELSSSIKTDEVSTSVDFDTDEVSPIKSETVVSNKGSQQSDNETRRTPVKRGKRSWLECNVCETIFSGKVAYNLHMLRHDGIKPYVCDYCHKGFTTVKSKVLHTRKHTGEKPFLCNLCGRGFERKGGLRYHLKAHERGAGSPVDCDICNRSFQTSSRLTIHKTCKHPTQQTYFSCEHCQKSFSFKRSLKRHIASAHLQEKKFLCTLCNRAFARNEYLVKHISNQHSQPNQTQIKLEPETDQTLLQYIDAATLAQLTEHGQVMIQGDLIINQSDTQEIGDNSTVVFAQDSVQYEVECLTTADDHQAIQLLVQASLQSQQ